MVNEKIIFLVMILYHNFWFWTVQQLYLQLLYRVQNQKLWYSEKIESCADFSGTSEKFIFLQKKSLIWLWIWHLFQWLILLYLMENITHAWIFFTFIILYVKNINHLNFVEKIWKSVLFQLYFWIYIFYYIFCI